MKKFYSLHEVAALIGTEEGALVHYIECEWIRPARRSPCEFDEEDLARARLIRELTDDFEVNDDAVPIILNLLDQIHGLHRKIRLRFSDDVQSQFRQ